MVNNIFFTLQATIYYNLSETPLILACSANITQEWVHLSPAVITDRIVITIHSYTHIIFDKAGLGVPLILTQLIFMQKRKVLEIKKTVFLELIKPEFFSNWIRKVHRQY